MRKFLLTMEQIGLSFQKAKLGSWIIWEKLKFQNLLIFLVMKK